MVFYGSEGHCPSQACFHQLRTAVVRAVFGDDRAASPFLTLSCLSSHLMDPVPYFLLQCLRLWRRFFHRDPTRAQAAWAFVTCEPRHSRDYSGPGAALRTMLARLGWTAHDNGLLKGPEHVRGDLHTTGTKELREQVRTAWMATIQKFVRHKHGPPLCSGF